MGATGMVGSEICRLLAADGKPVRAMVRESSNQAKTKRLKELGVQVVQGDLRNTSTFEPVLKGVASVITTMQKSFAGLMLCVAHGDPIDMKAVLQAFPIKLTSVKEYARSVVAAS